MPTILERYTNSPRPRLNLADWLAALPAPDRDALYAATRVKVAAREQAERWDRLRDPWAEANADTPNPLVELLAEIRGLREDLLQRPVPARPPQGPQWTPPPPKPRPAPKGVTIPTVE